MHPGLAEFEQRLRFLPRRRNRTQEAALWPLLPRLRETGGRLNARVGAFSSPSASFSSVSSSPTFLLRASIRARTRFSRCVYFRRSALTTSGSNAFPDSSISRAIAPSIGKARRYCRSEANASRKSTAARIRAPIGISVPFKPSGYPVHRIFRGAPPRWAPPDKETGRAPESPPPPPVNLHLLEFFRCQPSRLRDNVLGNRQLANIVQQCRACKASISSGVTLSSFATSLA